MPLEVAKCPSCDANIHIPDDKETAFCSYCGSSIKTTAAIEYGKVKIDGEVTVRGIATLDKLLQNAETFIKLNENNAASEIYKKIINEYPEDYRGWFGITKVITCNFCQCYLTQPEYDEYKKHMGNVKKLIGKDKLRVINRIDELYTNLVQLWRRVSFVSRKPTPYMFYFLTFGGGIFFLIWWLRGGIGETGLFLIPMITLWIVGISHILSRKKSDTRLSAESKEVNVLLDEIKKIDITNI